ncbi:FAD-dependent oxidoreductase [Candidatus Uabimicrobium sp. HlEnr_7]|uniref:FAD-dependent oxidoreductase n=1 Tax=Candidatus Uabimicrobium helgolandensis TaxID=3095367 RepID=UPI003556995E
MKKKQIVAVVGGACAGSEAAHQLTSKGIDVVVFEQNALPYGKIEDGLPRWHGKLQDREIKKIDEKLSQSNVQFVPNCKLGKDISLQQILDFNFSAVVLASGAWKDRPLSAEGLEEIENSSFCYQNPLIYWFNHYHEKNYEGETFPIKEGAVVIGGGLASIDVAKVCQLETVKQRLSERGIEADIIEMEHKGIPKYLSNFDIKYEELNIKPACIYYRRRDIDMPLAEMPKGCTPEKKEKVQNVRKKILANAHKKYFFEVQPLSLPKEIHNENGNVCGITFFKMRYDGDKLEKTTEEVYVETNFVVSSIGSIPQPIEEIPMKWETYDISDTVTGSITKYDGVYGVGNAVTGKGNIMVSNKHAKNMGGFIASSINQDSQEEIAKSWEKETEDIANKMQEIYQYLGSKSGISDEDYARITTFVGDLQNKSEYSSYKEWKDSILEKR